MTAQQVDMGDLPQKPLQACAGGGALLGAYRTFPITIADLAAATGYDFGPLAAADPLARRSQLTEAIAAGQPVAFGLSEEADMVL